ncbi:MAG: AAA family ATPase [Dehalococcoidia bacterium]|nr:AAA family ATPase [Dehalococcoidia bacterium]
MKLSYLDFFGLNEDPFQTSPSTKYFYSSQEHQECLARILLTLELNNGLFVAIGDAGTGKTSLASLVMRDLLQDDNTILALIRQPRARSEFAFLQKLNDSFGVIVSGVGRRSTLMLENSLFNFIQEKALEENKRLVLIVDEAQEMTPTQLLRIRELLNLETESRKLINMIFFGQLEFLNKIRSKRFKNFRQRVAMSYVLNPLNLKDTGELIKYRLKMAGSDGTGISYTEDAIQVIHKESKGLPRDICKLGAAGLLAAFASQTNVIDADTIKVEAQSMPIR